MMSLVGGRLWRHPDFLKLWGGQTVSMIGDHVAALALPTIAILHFHVGPLEVGLLATVAMLPYPVLAVPAGLAADRLPRCALMVAADLVRLAATLSVPVAFATGVLRLDQLYLVAFVNGSASAVFLASYRALLPSVVAPEDLLEGNGKLEGSHAAAHVAGPSAGGALIQALGAPLALVADVVSFGVSAASLLSIRHRQPARAAVPGTRADRASPLDGLRLLRRHPLLGRLAVADALNALGMAMGQSILLLFTYRVVGQSAGSVGALLAAGGVAAVAGAASAAVLTRRLGMARVLVLSSLLGSLAWAILVLALRVPPAPVIAAALCLQGFFEPVWTINAVSVRQRAVSPELQGRVHSAMAGLTYGVSPLGAFLGGTIAAAAQGWLGATDGLALGLLVAAVVGAESALWIGFSSLGAEAGAGHLVPEST
jgi:predicted MFS family arabinose efflux permease